MVRIMLRIIFILSVSLNVALVIHLLGQTSGQEINQINMSDSQKEIVNRIHLKLHKENESIKKQIRECQAEMVNALKADPVNRESVIQCIDKIGDLQKKIQMNTIEEIIQVKKVLDKHQCDCLINGLTLRLSQVSKPCDKVCCKPKK